MIVTKIVEITLRGPITYDEDKYSLHNAAEAVASVIASDGIYGVVELVGNNDFDPDNGAYLVSTDPHSPAMITTEDGLRLQIGHYYD